jgi:hypothetical protein
VLPRASSCSALRRCEVQAMQLCDVAYDVSGVRVRVRVHVHVMEAVVLACV